MECLKHFEKGSRLRRGKKRKEDRTPTQPGQQSSQAAAISMTQTAPATHTHKPGAAVQCCRMLHRSVYPEVSLVLRIIMLCSLASGGCRISPKEVPSALRQSKWAGVSGVPTCPSYLHPWGAGHMAPVPQSTTLWHSCLFFCPYLIPHGF